MEDDLTENDFTVEFSEGAKNKIKLGPHVIGLPDIDVIFIPMVDADISKYKAKGLVFLRIETNVDIDDEIWVLQHPLGGKLQYATGKVSSFDKHRIIHNVSTEEGSSGSPIFDNSCKIVGIHQASMKSKDLNAGCNMKDVQLSLIHI